MSVHTYLEMMALVACKDELQQDGYEVPHDVIPLPEALMDIYATCVLAITSETSLEE